MNDVEKYRGEIAERGESAVSDQLARGLYSPFKAGVAGSWLNELDREREDARQASEVGDRQTALDLARQANWIAIGALVISVIAIGITVMLR